MDLGPISRHGREPPLPLGAARRLRSAGRGSPRPRHAPAGRVRSTGAAASSGMTESLVSVARSTSVSSEGVSTSRRRRASTTVRACSNSEIEPNVSKALAAGSEAVSWWGGSRFVQAAGMRERLPSGRIRSRRRHPSRCIQPRSSSACPSHGWRGRVTVTLGGKPSRWVVCPGLL